jgi:uncharacterized protein DUF5996
MTTNSFPALKAEEIAATRDAVHAYAQVIGDWRTSCLAHRKHWWQITVLPSVRGLTTGMIQADGLDFELELDLRADRLLARVTSGDSLSEPLGGRSGSGLATVVASFLTNQGIDPKLVPEGKKRDNHELTSSGYSAEIADSLGSALRSISGAMAAFRAPVAEETSPIHIWPHHFDLAMLWLPGGKIPGQDPADEELSDEQMNFGFAFGDEGIPEPYFYITAYPLPDAMPKLALPEGAVWQSDGFSGAVLLYRRLLEEANPQEYLVNLWNTLLAAGRHHMLDKQS